MLRCIRLFLLLHSLALLTGCAGRNCAPPCCESAGQVLDCQDATRQTLRGDVSLVAAVSGPFGDRPQKLCSLPERTAQCLAATNASIANLLDYEADAVLAQRQPHHGPHGDPALTADLLRLEAVNRRNAAAAAALQTFFRLLEAEAGVENLLRRNQEADAMLGDIAQLQARDLLTPVSKTQVEDDRFTLWHRQAELQGTIQKLNYQLQGQMGVEVAAESRFWPVSSLVVTPHAPNRDEAVNFALNNRPDLTALRLAASANSTDRAAAARTILQMASGGLGTPPPSLCVLAMLVHGRDSATEADIRAQQLAGLLADREREATQQVRLAVLAVETRLVQIGLTRNRLDGAKQHLSAIEEQQELTGGSMLNIRKVRLDVLAIEQDLLHDVVEWKLAWVSLREAQGLLAGECGFDACHCIERLPDCCP